MKILNIFFKNINSLQGESRIDFDQAPIANAGIFAITGPNGSGKTSILDAITLGLYGETYRFSRPAEHVMTKQTSDCFAQIEFTVGRQKYRSKWRAERTNQSPEGEIMPATMQLMQLDEANEVILQNSPAEVRQAIFELTGMDFHKFSKSMVLSQGDFAAFLNALDSERLDILEKITGGDLYQEFREVTEQNQSRIMHEVQLLEQEIVALPIMETAAIEAAQEDLQDFNEQLDQYQAKIEKLSVFQDWHNRITELDNEQVSVDQRLATVSAECDKNEQILDKIKHSNAAAPFKDELTELDQQNTTVTESKKQLINFHKEIELLQQQLQSVPATPSNTEVKRDISQQRQAIEQLKQQIASHNERLPKENALLQSIHQQLVDKKSALTTVNDWLENNQNARLLNENFPEIEKLSRLHKESLRIQTQLKEQERWTKNTTSALKKNKADIKKVSKNLAEFNKLLANNKQKIVDWSHGKTFEELEDLQAEQIERVQDFKELHDLAKVNASVGKKGFFNFFKRSKVDMQREEHELIAEQNMLQLEIGKEDNIRKVLERAIYNETLIKRLQADRIKLEDGKPCPLCGATKHPYVNIPPPQLDSRKALAEQRGKLQALRSHADSLTFQIKELQKREQEEAEKEASLQKVRVQWNTLTNRLNTATQQLDINNFSLMKKLLSAERNQLNEINTLIKKCKKFHLASQNISFSIKKHEATLHELQTENKRLNEEWDNRPRELIELEKAYAATVAEEKTLTQSVEQELTKIGEKMPAEAQREELFSKLNTLRRDFQTYQLRKQALTEEIASLEEKVSLCQEDVDELSRALQAETINLKQEESIGVHLALVEKQRLAADKERMILEQEKTLKTTEQHFNKRLQEKGFTDHHQVRELLALLERKEEITSKLQQQKNIQAQLTTEKARLTEQLQAEQAKKLTEIDQEVVQQQLNKTLEQSDIAKMEVATLQKKLQQQTMHQNKLDELQQQLENCRIKQQECVADLQLINDTNAMPFRRKVQQQMAERLLSRTNSVLEKISGRYYVRFEPSEQGFALKIEDTHQNNLRRLPKTLSGGESFVVSLALAIALAESATNGHAVDSLFIDEGFGNLDAESLYLVMSTLESLKTQGKTVGIISHIETVKHRVKTQIEMIKKPNGYSALKLASG